MFNFIKKHKKVISTIADILVISSLVANAIAQFYKGSIWYGLICLLFGAYILLYRKQSQIIDSYQREICPKYKQSLEEMYQIVDEYQIVIDGYKHMTDSMAQRIKEHVDSQTADMLLNGGSPSDKKTLN